jgi:precorrin-2 C20-methyltransferase / precorrin-3B C17-methyltransferase
MGDQPKSPGADPADGAGPAQRPPGGAGRLWGVGLGPGDPELVTVKAARLIGAADVLAFHSGTHGRSIARRIAEPYVRAGQIEEPLVYPVTTGGTDHPGGYAGAIRDFYDEAARRLAKHLDDGLDVVVLCEGDPMFYGSYMYTHERLSGRYRAEVVPGVTSVSAAAAALGRPLVQRDEVLTILPGTLPRAELARRLADTDAAAVLKLGRTFGSVRDAVEDAGRGAAAWYVERASTDQQRTCRLREVTAAAEKPGEEPGRHAAVPYFSLALLTSPTSARSTEQPGSQVVRRGKGSESVAALEDRPPEGRPPEGRPREGRPPEGRSVGEVVVVGLGPGPPQWTTPQARLELEQAEHLVGYRTYLDRVPVRAGQQRHPSGNRVEADRADQALALAAGGARVAVVSSGDPGVFAMAAAVVEQAADPRWLGVPVRVVPGLTAAQAVASRVGAPLGHDFAVLSLSDRLKPWPVVVARLTALAKADLAIAVYNPRSVARPWQLGAALEVLLRQRDPATPVVVGRDVGGPQESVRVVALGSLDPATVDMRCLLIVGSSATRVVREAGSAGESPLVLTPRRSGSDNSGLDNGGPDSSRGAGSGGAAPTTAATFGAQLHT